jgi:hypothetical protein
MGLEVPFVGIATKKFKSKRTLIPCSVSCARIRKPSRFTKQSRAGDESDEQIYGDQRSYDPCLDVRFLRAEIAVGALPDCGGIRFVLDQVAVRDSRAKNFPPETFMDTRFVKQLEDSGFIKGLYPKG